MKKIIKLSLVFLTLINCQTNTRNNIIFDPPRIKGELFVDTIFDKIIHDQYRNIENTEDSTVINWYKKQTKYTQSFLGKINKRDSLIESIYEIDNRKSYIINRHFISEQDQRFYLKKNLGESNYKLYQNNVSWTNEELLFDPKTFKSESNNEYSINYIKPSWDDKYIVVSLSHSGKEISELIIIDTKSKNRLPVVLNNAWPNSFLGINWLPDNSGFTYLYFTNSDSSKEEFKSNSQSVLYTLGQNSKKPNFIFGNKTHPNLNITEKEYPTTKIKYQSDKYIIGYISGVNNFWRAYYTSIDDLKNRTPNWKLFYTEEDKVKTSGGILRGNEYIFISGENTENYRLASINMNDIDFQNPKILFQPNENEVINTFRATKDAIYISTTKFGIEAFLYEIKNNQTHKIELPKKAGRISLSSKSSNYNDIWVTLSGWTSSNERYKYDYKTNTFTEDNLSSNIDYPEFENISSKEVMVKSHDGEEVPLSIVYNKNIKLDGENTTFFYGYGFYGDGISPFFSPLFLKFVEEGGIIAIPHVRGGGEKGEKWRKGGFKTTKPNSWKDLIACVEYMITKKYTSKDKTAIYSSSAGGILVGRAMTERPDLFAAVISEVGVLNPTRMETQPGGGGSNIKEFGTMKDSTEAMALIEMDPYLHIKDSIDYPAVYLTVGMNDPRVVPWESGKFAARLQNATNLKKPVLLYADFEAGHEGNQNSDRKIYEEWGNVFSFVFWQTGHPNYQLKVGK